MTGGVMGRRAYRPAGRHAPGAAGSVFILSKTLYMVEYAHVDAVNYPIRPQAPVGTGSHAVLVPGGAI